ncbi:MAG: cell division protein ZapA [Mariprofundaceae bacterium]|nr:cell division protein ZapA [Mariprofundaceae bacterium]
MSQSVKVTLMGRDFSIRTQDDPEQVQAAAQLVQERVDELRKLGTTVASDRLLALVALNLAGEFLRKEETQHQDLGGLLSDLDIVVSQAQGLAEAPLR